LIPCMIPNCRIAARIAFLCLFVASLSAQPAPTTTNAISPKAARPSGAAVTVDLKDHFSVSEVPAQQLVRFATTSGVVIVEMLADAAPLNVANFLSYVDSGSYSDTVIHRAAALDRTSTTAGIVQGGGFKLPAPVMLPVDQLTPVALEAVLPNTRGTLAAARLGGDVNSATSGWYFNVSDNTRALGTVVTDDAGNEVSVTPAYTVFGRVIAGMDVVDALANLPRMNIGGIFQDFPYRDYHFDRPMDATNTIVVSSVSRIGLYPNSGPGLLEFSASSSDPAIASVAISGSTLSINPGTRLGATTIQVKARVAGNEVSSSFNFTVSADAMTGATAAEQSIDAGDRGRLRNLSVRSIAGSGQQTLIAGFNLSGASARTLLIRATGPGLSAFGVEGVAKDPVLEIFRGSERVAGNDNWGGAPAIDAACEKVGAFKIGDTNSKDAALVLALDPGSYTAQVRTADGSAGIVLLEVYALP